MKTKAVLFLAALLLLSNLSFGQFFKNLEKSAGINNAPFSQDDAANAIKEALTNGIKKGVDKVSVANGYFGNPAIKIPFPPEASKVESALRGMGMGSTVDKVVETSNHAAENAATKATPIFIDAIKKLTITDAINLVNTKQQDAATQFLKKNTTEALVVAFKPSIKDALDKIGATQLWSDLMNEYNKIPFHGKVNTDLPDYVTRKAIDGLFYMIAKEEAAIRQDPAMRTSALLQKVFGNIKL